MTNIVTYSYRENTLFFKLPEIFNNLSYSCCSLSQQPQMNRTKFSVALVDDHVLIRSGLANLIREFGDFDVIIEANNGRHFQDTIPRTGAPDIVLLDITMP